MPSSHSSMVRSLSSLLCSSVILKDSRFVLMPSYDLRRVGKVASFLWSTCEQQPVEMKRIKAVMI